MAHDGHVVRAVALAQARLVVGKHHVEHPMQAGLNAPVPAHAVRGARGGERRGRDVGAGLEPAAILQLGAGCDLHHTGHVRQAQLAGKAPRALKPVDVAGHGDGALLDAPMPLVEVRGAIKRSRLGRGEQGLDLGAERGLVGLDGRSSAPARRIVPAMAALVATASIETSAPLSPSSSARRSIRAGMAVVSLALSGTASWPSTRRAVVAKAETRCSGGVPVARSWLRREVLPSMATNAGRSGQDARTQAVKAAANRPGLMRFINCVSQRPPGTP